MGRKRTPFTGTLDNVAECETLSCRKLVRLLQLDILCALQRGCSVRDIVEAIEQSTDGLCKPKTVRNYVTGKKSVLVRSS